MQNLPNSGALALAACHALDAAYRKGQRNGGSIDWEDVDQAHERARKAIRRQRQEGKKSGGGAISGPVRVEPDQPSQGCCLCLVDRNGSVIARSPVAPGYGHPEQAQDARALEFLARLVNAQCAPAVVASPSSAMYKSPKPSTGGVA